MQMREEEHTWKLPEPSTRLVLNIFQTVLPGPNYVEHIGITRG